MRFPKHPFAVRTLFRRCFLVNFAVDPTELASALPRHLVPDVRGDEAFVSVVVGEMDKMRPAGVPRPLGISYNQIVYRAAVRCGDDPGVHFLRSDADSKIMTASGNLMSFFRFHHANIRFTPSNGSIELDVTTTTTPSADIAATFTVDSATTQLPASSVFSTLDDAKRWLVERYTAFDFTEGQASIDVVKIRRGEWDIKVVHDTRAKYAFMSAGAPFTTARLDCIFSVGDIPYHWYRLAHRPCPPT
jgi:uncharacterized protein YqjF (DUF2071 family)